jgi:hypothetical protein
MLSLAENRELAHALGNAARTRAFERHLPEHFSAALERALTSD